MTQSASTLQITTPTDREIVMTREFDAPRDLVFEAWANPEHVRNCWGMRNETMLVCEGDVRPAGSGRYCPSGQDGGEGERAARRPREPARR